MATVKRQASVQSHSDNSDTLYTLSTEWLVRWREILAWKPFHLDALCELDEMSDGELSQALKAEDLFESEVIRPDVELNSSPLMDE